jgi:exopolyphosphatase / guanosine-5'-triphosphate,3'-diphosphate pyrophosphatase
MSRLQAIDIGTNSVRSIVVEVPVGGARRVIDDEKAMTRLGQGLDATGMLGPEAIDRTIEALKAMRDIGSSLGVTDVRAIATEAVRRANNGGEFVARVREEAGIEVEVISAEEEGRLVWLSSAAQVGEAPFSAMIDIGGGSVEIVQVIKSEPAEITSLRLGARVLAEHYVTEDPLSDESFKLLKRHVRRTLRDGIDVLTVGVSPLVGSGGAVTTVAAVVAGMRGRRYESLHGIEVSRAEVMQLLGILSHSDTAERLSLPGLPAERVDVVLPGTLVLAEVMKLFGASSVLVNALGIREGIVIDTLASEGAIAHKADHLETVRNFGAHHHYDRQHAEQVTHLALSLFDQLAEPLGLDPQDRPLLRAAAMLHDIGYSIAYDQHHKHSYHLIIHASLPPFTRREMSMVASISRYHTKSLPKRAHESWASLDPPDRLTVRSLAAVLRIADGLDRSHAARVFRVEAVDDGAVTRLTAFSSQDLHTELYGVEKKKDLFEEAFARSVLVEAASFEETI